MAIDVDQNDGSDLNYVRRTTHRTTVAFAGKQRTDPAT